ncbi:selenite/tellurite reduction operon porin ExtI [Desulfurivibrio sp. D14AmB]|uniref:selenite/tellurite reduction operon porin ExtI n=1 Tax=Desulfurivibrio sp. D14AmB TaxID=3374370 RepID=UPI00376F0227
MYKKMLGFGLTAGLLLGVGLSPATAGPVIYLPNDAGWLQLNYEMQLYGQWRDTGSGADGTDNTTDVYFRRNRVSLMGMSDQTYGFYFAMEQTGNRRIHAIDVQDNTPSDFSVLDAYFMANFNQAANLRVGLLKDPLVRAHNTGCFFDLTRDRSEFVYTSIPRRSRDYGMMLWGNLVDQRLQYKLAITTGVKGANTPGSDLRYTARAHYSFLDPEPIPLYFGTYFGAKRVLTVGAGYQFEKDAAYSNQTLQTGANDYSAWTVDLFGELPTPIGTFTAEAAYLDSSFDDNYQGWDPDPVSYGIDGEKNGYYLQGGYLLADPVGPGQLQFFGRYENWSFANLQSIYDQEIDRLALGVNYYLRGNDIRLTLEWAETDFERETATVQDFTTVTAMLQYRF